MHALRPLVNCPKNVGNVAGYTRPTENGMGVGGGGATSEE